MNGQAFAVTVDRKVIYYCIFKPMTSSSTCEHSLTMVVDAASGSRIVLSRGYPGSLSWPAVDDQRNNPVLLAALSAQKKLR
jgi:hypothetical protein